MARPPAYRLYSEFGATMHVGNDLDELIAQAEQLHDVLGHRYFIKDNYLNTVWEVE